MQRRYPTRVTFLASLAGLWTANACIPEFDEDLSLVEEPRILAVRAEPAEVEEKEPVQLAALVAVPQGGTTLTPVWAFCSAPKPLTELGPVAQPCIEDFGSTSPILKALGRGAAVDAVVPENACRVFGPIPPDSAAGDPSRPVDPDDTGGFYQPVLAGTSDRDRTPSFGRVRVSCGLTGLAPDEARAYRLGYRRNENPAIDELVARVGAARFEVDDGGSFAVEPGSEVSFEVSWTECPREASCGDGVCSPGEERAACPEDCREPRGCAGAETYAVFERESRSIGFRREGITVAWYSDVGGFSVPENGVASSDPESTTEANRWRAPASERDSRLWIVLRDERGGVGFRSITANVRDR
ncbi:MAG TPA: hypothetical protein VI197_28855 [Polyangiaceae bacterium]